MGLVVLHIAAANDKVQAVPQPQPVHDVLDGLPRLGADDAQPDAPGPQPPEQLRRPREQEGLLPLAGLCHLQKEGPELGLALRVPVPGEHGICILQQIADGAPHRLPVGDGVSQPLKAILKARHDGVSGVPQGVIKVKANRGIVFHSLSLLDRIRSHVIPDGQEERHPRTSARPLSG